MGMFDAVDWNAMFVPRTPVLEIVIRGSIVYLAIFVLLRVVLKRQSGTVGITDLLVLVLIADAAQNAMAGEYRSVPAGILLVATIVFWSFALDWLGYRVRWIGRFIHPPPLELIRDGKIIWQNMRKELVTRDELMSQLREQGIEDVAHVGHAHMEGDGQISVTERHEHHHDRPQQRRT